MNKGFVIWLTGLPSSGKTTIARILENQFRNNGHMVEVLDGDEVRKHLSFDLGFSMEDREKQARRVTYLCKLLIRNGVVVIVSLVSPLRAFRDNARQELSNFIEDFVKCSIETCMKRDHRGLYKKALAGEITDMTGVQQPFEEPVNPEVIVDTEAETPESCASKVIAKLEELGYIH